MHALSDFAAGRRPAGARGAALGTADAPGTFRIAWASLARTDDRSVEPMVPLPADLFAADTGGPALTALQPMPVPAGAHAGIELPMVPVLRVGKAVKPAGARLLDGAGLHAYLRGELPPTSEPAAQCFAKELRLGIALHPAARTAEEGKLYTSEAVRFARRSEPWPDAGAHQTADRRRGHRYDAGYLVGVRGAPGLLPERGTLRLGGDARAAHFRRIQFEPPAAPLAQIAADRRFRLVMQTPAIFPSGWLPAGVRRNGGDYRLQGQGFAARLACAAVPRHEVVSGWDLARMRPKVAQRAVAAGAVYWFDQLEGDAGKLAEWVDGGIWADDADAARRAEGFNRAWLGAWR
jgi:CRISPR-associated protein Cmr3